MDQTEAVQRVWDLVAKADICMFTTRSRNGVLRGRPMSSIAKPDEGVIYYLTDAASGGKDDEIEADSQVHLGFATGSSHLSVSGTAKLSQDRALIERLWNPGAQAFWPQGPSQPGITVIAVTPSQAELWDGPGKIVGALKFAAALATGAPPDLGTNVKVKL